MKVIIFGATGYLGSHVAEQLLLAGREVVAVVRSTSNCDFLRTLSNDIDKKVSLTIVSVDFSNLAELANTIDEGSVVYSCVADTRMHVSDNARRQVEVELASRLFNAAAKAKAKRFIQLSTVMAYGFDRPETAIDETYPCSPKYSYSRIAVEREQALLALHRNSDLELLILRPSNTLGKRDSSALPSLLGSLEKGKFPVIGGGDWQFSCMDARDVGRAMVHLLELPVQQPEIFLVKGFDITWLDVKAALDKKLGKPSTLMNVPKGIALFLGRIMEAVTPFGKEPALTRFSASVVSTHTLFDDSKIRRSGFKSQYSLEATLDDALE